MAHTPERGNHPELDTGLLYLSGLDLISIQELLGHSWIASTLNYIHVHRTRIEDAWIAGGQRAAHRLEGLLP
jgi:site-specific recombinase XerC